MFALGAASGYFSRFKSFLAIILFGNLTANVFLLFVTFFEIRLLSFNFNMKEIGPGQHLLYNLRNLLFKTQSFFKSFKL